MIKVLITVFLILQFIAQPGIAEERKNEMTAGNMAENNKTAQGANEELTCGGWPESLVKTVYPKERWGYYLPRTMRKLSATRRSDEPPFTVVFYGDSVVAQDWGTLLLDKLKERYPRVTFSHNNLAIGGQSWQTMKRYAYNDILPIYPDLVVLSSWGNDMSSGPHAQIGEAYYSNLEETIKLIRSNTTAEIMLLTYHQLPFKNRLMPRQTEPSMEAIRLLAGQYGCELVDMLEDWREYITGHSASVEEFLIDGVHLNGKGIMLMADLAARHFQSVLPVAPELQSGAINRYEAEMAREEKYCQGIQYVSGRWELPDASTFSACPGASSAGYIFTKEKNAAVSLEFTGNRVDVLYLKGKGGGLAGILIDGKKPSSLGLFSIARARWDEKNQVPPKTLPRETNIKRVTLGLRPVAEGWTITILNDKGDFAATGSVSGDGGCGNIHRRFESRNGQFSIEPQDFFQKLTPGQRFYFSIAPEYSDEINCLGDGELVPARTTVAKSLPPGAHRIDIAAAGDGFVFLDAIEVFEPPLREFAAGVSGRLTGAGTPSTSANAFVGILKNLTPGFSEIKDGDIKLVSSLALSGSSKANIFHLQSDAGGGNLLMVDSASDCELLLLNQDNTASAGMALFSQDGGAWRNVEAAGRFIGIPVSRRWNVVKGVSAKPVFLEYASKILIGGMPVDNLTDGQEFEWRISISNPLDEALTIGVQFPGGDLKTADVPAHGKSEWSRKISAATTLFPLRASISLGRNMVQISDAVELLPEYPCLLKAGGEIDKQSMWAELPVSAGFYILRTGERATQKTTSFQACWTPEAFYVKVRCEEPNKDRMRIHTQSEGGIWGDDEIELFIALPGCKEYFQFVSNFKGKKWAGYSGKPEDQPIDTWSVNCSGDDNSWSLLFKIPFKGTGIPKPTEGERLLINIARQITTVPDENRYSCWAHVTDGKFNQTGKFGVFVLRKQQ